MSHVLKIFWDSADTTHRDKNDEEIKKQIDANFMGHYVPLNPNKVGHLAIVCIKWDKCSLGMTLCMFLSIADFFFKIKIISGILSECQTDWIALWLDILSEPALSPNY